MPNIGKTDQNDLGIQSNSPKAIFVTNLELRHNINREVFPTKVLAGKKILHAISQEISRVETKIEGNGWVKTVNDGANTSKPKQWWE